MCIVSLLKFLKMVTPFRHSRMDKRRHTKLFVLKGYLITDIRRSMEVDMLRILIIYMVLQFSFDTADAYSVSAINCNQPDKIFTYSTASICKQEVGEPEAPLGINTAVLQLPKSQQIRGYSCTVRYNQVSGQCGAWGHVKLREAPSFNRYLHISVDKCQEMVRNKKFVTPTGEEVNIKFNEPVFVKSNQKGSLQLFIDKNIVVCKPEPQHLGGKLLQNSVVIVEYEVLIQEQSYLVTEKQIETETDQIHLSCPPLQRSCITGRKTYLWSMYSSCALTKVSTFLPMIKGSLYISHQQHFLLNITGTASLPGCKISTLKATAFDNIFVADATEVQHLPVILPYEINVDTSHKSMLSYLSHTMNQQLQQLEKSQLTKMCLISSDIKSDETFKISGLTYGKRRGDTIYIYHCKVEQAEIRSAKTCYDRIPLKNNLFMDFSTRLIHKFATVIPCLKRFPIQIRTDSGIYVALTPEISQVPTPPDHQPWKTNTTINEENFAVSGLYTEEEMESYDFLIDFPSYKEAMLSELSFGTCSSTACHPVVSSNSQRFPNFDLSRLTDPEGVIEDLYSPAHFFKTVVQKYANYCAIIIALIWTIKTAINIITLLAIWTICGFAATSNLFCEFYLFNLSMARRAYRARKSLPTAPQYQMTDRQPVTSPLAYPNLN